MNINTVKKGDIVRQNILESIICYINEHGYCPSVREICGITGLRSTSSVQNHITKMLETGMLETDCGIGTPRALRIPGYKFMKVE